MNTNITKHKLHIEEVKQIVCERLHINSDTYEELFFETGCSYLELRYTKISVKKLRAHPLFWKWWRVQFTIRDREFLRETRHNIERRTQIFYIGLHVNMNYTPGKNITNKILNEKLIK